MPEYIVIRYFRDKIGKPIVMFPTNYKDLIKALRMGKGGDCVIVYRIYQEYDQYQIEELYTE